MKRNKTRFGGRCLWRYELLFVKWLEQLLWRQLYDLGICRRGVRGAEMFVKVRIWDIKEKQIYCLKRRRVLEVVGIQRAYLEEGH